MSTFNFQILNTDDQDLNRVQSNIKNTLNNVSSPFIGGILLTGKEITIGATAINHGLSQTPQVWVVCDNNANAVVWRTSWNSNTITLQASATCIISFWVA